jgi:hypothetical protein
MLHLLFIIPALSQSAPSGFFTVKFQPEVDLFQGSTRATASDAQTTLAHSIIVVNRLCSGSRNRSDFSVVSQGNQIRA